MPTALKDATKDLIKNKIDEETYHERRKQRTHFELRLKEKPDDKGRAPRMCPALGMSPTVTCPLRELLNERASRTLPEVAAEDLPDIVDKICRQHSVSFTKEETLRQDQKFVYKSSEWEAFHRHARNSIESLNAQVKDHNRESIEDSSRRLVRGFAAAQLFITILLSNYNLRKIAAFLRDEAEAQSRLDRGLKPAAPIKRRRDREFYNPYTKTYPSSLQAPQLELVGLQLTA